MSISMHTTVKASDLKAGQTLLIGRHALRIESIELTEKGAKVVTTQVLMNGQSETVTYVVGGIVRVS